MQEFERCPFGIIGLETAIGLTLEKLVHPGLITMEHMVRLFTTGPARILGLDAGTLSVAAAADVTVLNPEMEWTYDVNSSLSRSRNSPFHGHKFRGGQVATIVDGVVVWQCN
jgi:dihydroorotase